VKLQLSSPALFTRADRASSQIQCEGLAMIRDLPIERDVITRGLAPLSNSLRPMAAAFWNWIPAFAGMTRHIAQASAIRI
jgi:hypothetical protein